MPRSEFTRMWRNWQTRQIQVLVGVKSLGGSTPLIRIQLLKVRPCPRPEASGFFFAVGFLTALPIVSHPHEATEVADQGSDRLGGIRLRQPGVHHGDSHHHVPTLFHRVHRAQPRGESRWQDLVGGLDHRRGDRPHRALADRWRIGRLHRRQEAISLSDVLRFGSLHAGIRPDRARSGHLRRVAFHRRLRVLRRG